MGDVSDCGGWAGVDTFSWGDVNYRGNGTTICNGEESGFACEGRDRGGSPNARFIGRR